MTGSRFIRTVKPNVWFACHRPNPGASLRLFCFPYAGGGAQTFREWPDLLPPSVEVYPVQLPGRGARITEKPFTSIESLVETAAGALLPLLDKPFVLFGHSMGALVAFELARHLRRRAGLLPRKLIVSARVAPQVPDPSRPIHGLPEPELIAELRRLKGTPEELLNNAELLNLLLPTLQADLKAHETYVYESGPRLSCPIAALGGLQDDEVPGDSLQAWREQTTATFSHHLFGGDHFFLNTRQPFVLRIIAQELYPFAEDDDCLRSL